MAEVFVLRGGTPTPTEFRPGSPKTVNHRTPISPQSPSKVPERLAYPLVTRHNGFEVR